MAYFDPNYAFSSVAASPMQAPEDVLSQLGGFAPAPVASEVEPSSFDHTEWAVITLARQDSLETLREPRRSRLGELIFGKPRHYTLAGERLEALRRIAVEAWRKPQNLSLQALGAFISVGFTSAQLALLLSTTGALPAMASLIAHAAPKIMSRKSA